MTQEVLDIKSVLKNAIWLVITITLVLFGVVFVLVSSDGWVTQERFEKALTVTSSYFGGITTLIAAYMASRMYSDWREQKDHDTKTEYLNNAIHALNEIHVSLILCRSNATNLKEINLKTILISRYIDDFAKQHNGVLVLLYSNLNIADSISKSKLLEIYNDYDKYIYIFNIYNQMLMKKYRTYFNYYIDKFATDITKTNLSITEPDYGGKMKIDPTHRINMSEINKLLSHRLVREIAGKVEYTNYFAHLDDCIEIHGKLFDACIKELKATE